MSAKAILVFCAQALLVQSAMSQCIGRGTIDLAAPYGYTGSNFAATGFGYNGLTPYSYDSIAWGGSDIAYDTWTGMDFTPTSGGGLPVTSISPISPTGILVVSDNAYEGPVSVIGELPFLSAVVIEGVLPTAGSGAINHACGNGVTAMISEGVAPAYGPAGYGPGFGPAGYGPVGPAGYGQVGPAMGPRMGFGGCGRGMLY